jgi:hypothetical protein
VAAKDVIDVVRGRDKRQHFVLREIDDATTDREMIDRWGARGHRAAPVIVSRPMSRIV